MKMHKSERDKVTKQFGLYGNKAMCDLTGVPIMSYNGEHIYGNLFIDKGIEEREVPLTQRLASRKKDKAIFPLEINYED